MDAGRDPLRTGDRLAITALNDRFGEALDHAKLDQFLDLFADGVIYVNGDRVLRGVEELRAFFMARAEAGRVSRHIYSGLQITFDQGGRATGRSVWLTFAGEGPVPVSRTDPFVVADVTDEYRRDDAGTWRIATRHIRPVFRNPAIAAVGAKA
ncbi:nuclear transport factor 2 family protein [Plastorhodobacter daqingensis]|uniref:Nuclear transport factor 2 family protein n=1 Tax=Plastorhodobacter daqingensis TaxID=1387281 RepID=A0ABW2UGA1_9RHOB